MESPMPHNPKGALKRKIQLKNQALRLIRSEREELSHQLALLEFKEYLEKQLGQNFNPYQAQQLETVQALMDSLDTSFHLPLQKSNAKMK